MALVPDESYSGSIEGGAEYFLHFRFLPVERLGAPDARIFVRVFSDPDFVPYDWIARLDEAGRPVEPVMTRSGAAEIAAALGIPDFDARRLAISLRRPTHLPGPSRLEGWTWVLRVPEAETSSSCRRHHLVVVDAVTGSARNLGRVKECPELKLPIR